MKLTYKFNNDENNIVIDKKDYLEPDNIEVFTREGDIIYVNTGDYVYINQLLIESPTGIKTYSSISGTVERKQDSLLITNDKTNSALVSDDVVDSIDDIPKDEILNICDSIGLSFENRPITNKLKTYGKILVVNAMDVEPYQFNSNYLFQDNVKNLLDTIYLLSTKFNMTAYLLLNKYDTNNIYNVNTLINNYPTIRFKVINEVFPYNTNGVIAQRLFKEYKMDEMVFLDTMSLYKIYIALKDKLPVTERYITVVLDDPNKAYVINAKYGANLRETISKTVTPIIDGKDIFLNNFMRKAKCVNFDTITVTDNTRSVFIFEHSDEVSSKCIKCGKCVEICPVGINPIAKKLDNACIRCGLCNYVCPANRNLISREKEDL